MLNKFLVSGRLTADPEIKTAGENSERSGANPLAIIAGVATLAGVGGIGYYITKKRK